MFTMNDWFCHEKRLNGGGMIFEQLFYEITYRKTKNIKEMYVLTQLLWDNL